MEYKAINRVIQSNRFTMGEEVKEFEQKFAEKMQIKYAVMSNSGSSANLLAIAALVYSGRLLKGDEVIVPAVSWSTTYFPLCQHGLKLKFVDINKDTLNIDCEQIKDAISEDTKAIFAVNLLGNANKYNELLSICNKNNLILIEDNCEAMGGKYEGKALGTFGLMGTYSTFYSHHLCTMEGGITVTDNEELYHYLLAIRAHGWTRNLPEDSKIYTKNNNDFYESFNFIVPGYNLRPLEIEAAIGIEQLKKLDKIINQRVQNANYFREGMKNISNIRIQQEIGDSSWFGFAMVVDDDNTGKRDNLVNVLKQNNIEVRPIVAGNFTRNIAIKYMDYAIYGDLKNANDIHDNGLFIGNHCHDNSSSIDHVINILKKELL
jgi:CDP-6-deoxy-D-xylo-4-hexulose-3-dehydrase